MQNHTVAVVAFREISPFHLSVPCLVFGESHPKNSAFDLLVCSFEDGPLITSAGFSIAVDHGLEVLESAQTIIVPSWRDPHERPPQPLLDALVAAHQRGAQLVGLCLGAFVLAEAGLLEGRQATTHWAWAWDFAQRFPGVQLDTDVLYVADGNILTSAGTSAGLDCCLHLLRQQLGSEIANHVARKLVMPPHRQGGQAQFIEQPLPATARDSRLAGLLDWIRANLQIPHTVDSLAEKSLMSRRTFTRHFRQLTGTTVNHWLLSERLALSQRLLETTNQSIEHIANLVGFGSPVTLRFHFSKAFKVTPTAWRKTFQGVV
ncbi:MAG: AraC family transcriptional regulator [Proteobacteria bacterium]|nr:AraC family transcriptional regulator [Pseudomonadota bacterium]